MKYPHLIVIWDFAQSYYAKCLYGRSFRAPTFWELYDPAGGNPDLKPMTKDNYELSFGVRFLPSFTAQATGYYFKGEDAISINYVGSPPRAKYTNLDKGKGSGVELKMKYDFGRGTYLSMNYTYEDLKLWDAYGNPEVSWWTPKHLGTLTGNIRLNKYLNLNAYLLYRGGWERFEGDPRDAPSVIMPS